MCMFVGLVVNLMNNFKLSCVSTYTASLVIRARVDDE